MCHSHVSDCTAQRKAQNSLIYLLEKFHLPKGFWQRALEVIAASIQETHGREERRFPFPTLKRSTATSTLYYLYMYSNGVALMHQEAFIML